MEWRWGCWAYGGAEPMGRIKGLGIVEASLEKGHLGQALMKKGV